MKILLIAPSWVGDLVMTQTLCKCLHQRYINCEITVMAPFWCLPVAERMAEVHEVRELPFKHGELALFERYRLARALAKEGFEQVIVVANSFKSGLLPYFSAIPTRTGWRGEARSWLLNDCRKLDKSTYPLMIQRLAALAYPEGATLPETLPLPELKAEPARSLLAAFNLSLEKPIVSFCPGAVYGPAKQWPVRHFAKLARQLLEKGKQVWLFGSEKDAPFCQKIIEEASDDVFTTAGSNRAVGQDQVGYVHSAETALRMLAGHTTLTQAIDLLALSEVVISNDSGLMHIAAALQRPLVVLYGSTSANFTPPLTQNSRKVQLDLPCQPCFKRVCPLRHQDCLEKLMPAMVMAAINELID
jgi:heptosyltransferase-2